MMTQSCEQLIREMERIAREAQTPAELMRRICEKLNQRVRKYNWVGFYMLEESVRDPEKMGVAAQDRTPRAITPVLVLGPYVGAPTPHTRIPLDQGICGAAASSGDTVVVDDVRSDPRYLACSLETRSEIVVPVYVNGKVVGELDIDSDSPAAFGPEDRDLLARCAALVGRYLETHPE